MTGPTSVFASLLAVAMLVVAAPALSSATAAEPVQQGQPHVGYTPEAVLTVGPSPPPVPARPTDHSCPSSLMSEALFTDVPSNSPHRRAIDCVAHWFIAQGLGAQTYGPTRSVTRAQMSTFITRLIEGGGGILPDTAPDAFIDDNGSVHEANINKLAAAGVASGKSARSFAPAALVSRAQLATFLTRAVELVVDPLPTPQHDHFTDDDQSTHQPNINRMAEAGITTGTSSGLYHPNGQVRRDQMASFLARALDLLVERTGATPPSLDMAQLLTHAKAGSGGTAPRFYTGAKTCPAHFDRPSDAGDDTVADIGEWGLSRQCDGVYHGVLAATADIPALQAAWITINSKVGGCQGSDHVVVGWHDTDADGAIVDGRGAVIATPGCDPASWDWIEPAGFPVWNFSWLELNFRESVIGSPGAFHWRGYVQAVGETGDAIDAVPNAWPEHFIV